MNLYWYWPFGRAEESALTTSVLRDGDHLLVHTINRPGAVASDHARVQVVADLPEVAAMTEGSSRWLLSRARTYVNRSRLRGRLVARSRPDVCHVMFVNRFTDALELRRLRRYAPLVVSAHDPMPHHLRLSVGAERSLMRLSYRAADIVIAHNDHVAATLVDDLSVEGSRIRVVPLPVPEVDARLRPRPDPPTILMFGTLRRNKGLADLLTAMALLVDPDLRLHIAGRGTAELEALAHQAAERDPRITAELGWVSPERKHALYCAASVVVLPYARFDSQSGVLLDAYAYGVPVVVTDVGALGTDVRLNGTGWVVPGGSPDALADALREAVHSSDRREKARGAAEALARERTPALIGRRLRAVYDELG